MWVIPLTGDHTCHEIASIDAVGALQYITCRGIDRRKIFQEDGDRDKFMGRLRCVLNENQSDCYLWAPTSNHITTEKVTELGTGAKDKFTVWKTRVGIALKKV